MERSPPRSTSSDSGRLTDEFARTHDARLADLFATEQPAETTVDLRVVYAFDHDDRYVVLRCPVEGHLFPALSDLDPAAFVEECEIYEQVGIRPDNHKPLNRVHMAPNVQGTFTRLRPRAARAADPPARTAHDPG